jgi:hypothetical protein
MKFNEILWTNRIKNDGAQDHTEDDTNDHNDYINEFADSYLLEDDNALVNSYMELIENYHTPDKLSPSFICHTIATNKQQEQQKQHGTRTNNNYRSTEKEQVHQKQNNSEDRQQMTYTSNNAFDSSSNDQPFNYPPLPKSIVENEPLMNVLHAWYYCGYQTGVYDAYERAKREFQQQLHQQQQQQQQQQKEQQK